MANDKIIIDLSKSLNARSFEGTDIIHKTEFDRVKKLIDDKIKDNDISTLSKEDLKEILLPIFSIKVHFLQIFL